MSTNWWNFRKTVILFLAFSSCIHLQSQNNIYEEKLENYRSKWDKLIPKYTKIQFAGGMGLLSFGTGWNYGKNKMWETDIFLGFIPKYDADKFRLTFTLKQNLIPWRVDLNQYFSFDPFSCSFYVNTILNGDYWINEPDKYPNGYYPFATKLRFNFSVGQRFTFHIPIEKRRKRESISFFYEVGTNELYIISAIGNDYIKLTDILKLSLGIKVQIF